MVSNLMYYYILILYYPQLLVDERLMVAVTGPLSIVEEVERPGVVLAELFYWLAFYGFDCLDGVVVYGSIAYLEVFDSHPVE